MLLLGAVAWAQESDDGQEELDFSSGLGAKVRLMQLEAALERNIAWGEDIVSAVEADGGDAGGLSAILAEMRALKGEVAAIEPGRGEEAAQEFVDIKATARELTREFRVEARGLLAPDEADGLRDALRERDRGENGNLSGEISRFRHEYNAERASDAFDLLGAPNQELVDAVKSGEASWGDVMKYVNGVIKGMDGQERKQAKTAFKEKDSQRVVFGRALSGMVRYRMMERLNQSMEERMEHADELNLTDEERERLEGRMENVSDRLERIRDHMEAVIDKWVQKRTDNIERHVEMLENRTDKLTGRMEDRLSSGNLTGKQEDMLEDRLEKFQDRSDGMNGRMQGRLEDVEEKGNRMKGKFGISGGDEE